MLLQLTLVILYFGSLTSATPDTGFDMTEDHLFKALREGLLRSENAPKLENKELSHVLQQLLSLYEYQKKINKGLQREVVSLTHAVKAYSNKLQSQNIIIESLQRKQAVLIQKVATQTREIANLQENLRKQEEKTDENAVLTDHTVSEAAKELSKRIVLHSDVDLLKLVTSHGTDIHELEKKLAKNSGEIQDIQNDMIKHTNEISAIQNEVLMMQKEQAKRGPGSTYVRWGRKGCPSINGTELVYSGFVGGSWYANKGSAANYICLSPDPLWGYHNDGHSAGAQVYGTEYELDLNPQFSGTNIKDEDVPCSVCRSSRATVIMIPGRNQCYSGWTMEFKGYLAAGHDAWAATSEYICLDDHPETLQNGQGNLDGALLFFVEGRCGTLPCPPYVDGRELTCVVCSK